MDGLKDWKFKEGDRIVGGREDYGRIVSRFTDDAKNEFYRIFWITNHLPDAEQFRLFRKDVIETFYRKDPP